MCVARVEQGFALKSFLVRGSRSWLCRKAAAPLLWTLDPAYRLPLVRCPAALLVALGTERGRRELTPCKWQRGCQRVLLGLDVPLFSIFMIGFFLGGSLLQASSFRNLIPRRPILPAFGLRESLTLLFALSTFCFLFCCCCCF